MPSCTTEYEPSSASFGKENSIVPACAARPTGKNSRFLVSLLAIVAMPVRGGVEHEDRPWHYLRQLQFEADAETNPGTIGDPWRRIDADHPAAMLVADPLDVRGGGAEKPIHGGTRFASKPTYE